MVENIKEEFIFSVPTLITELHGKHVSLAEMSRKLKSMQQKNSTPLRRTDSFYY